MEQLQSLLSWNVSARDPLVLMILLGVILGLAMLLTFQPRLYLPLVLFTSPLPKLFTLTTYESWGDHQTSSGFSVSDLVLAAGIVALLFHRVNRPRSGEDASFRRALLLWSASVAFSVIAGLILGSGIYQSSNALYALRYVLTLASFVFGAAYAVAGGYVTPGRTEVAVGKLLERLAIVGNVVLALGILFYFTVGPTAQGGSELLFNNEGTVFRSFLFFFDYGADMGYFAVTIAILNIILLTEGRTLSSRIVSGVGIPLGVVAVLLLGERVNVLVLAVSLGYLLLETARVRSRTVGLGLILRISALIALVVVGIVFQRAVAPAQITEKFDNIANNAFSVDATDIMAQAGVPQSVTTVVAGLPIGDFADRLALSVASLWYFFSNPFGVGFWGELPVVGWYSHHEIVKIAIEQSFYGLAALFFLIVTLKRLLWSRTQLPGASGRLGLLLRSVSVGFFAAFIASNTVILDMKFAVVYWTLVGVWSVLPTARPAQLVHMVVREREGVHA